MLVLNTLMLTLSLYLLWPLTGLKRALMLIFVISYSCIVAAEFLVLIDYLKATSVHFFALNINYISSCSMVLTLALDRLFFGQEFSFHYKEQRKCQKAPFSKEVVSS